ncbi:Riboflavin biosynthesis protein ribF [Rickettsiales bacterium Ac37b]|nr:Riboflavin biosynthesis protein ribF [Rickettsiales bacterium Ac37b]
MRIIRHFSEHEIIENSILTIGNFDGVHIGHQELIREVCSLAKEHNTSSVLITFEPHPASVLSYQKNFRIVSLRNKILALKKLGINILYLQHFTRDFAKISAQEFIENILIKYFNPKHIIIGYDFVFGNNREGNGQLLQQYAESYNIGFTRFYPVKIGDQNVSSSLIRKLLAEGRIKEASCLLGYEYYITGFALNKGNISDKFKLPVAEMYLYNILCPKLGMYKATVEINNNLYEALVNIKMSREDKATGCLEICILNCKYELHNRRIQVKLLEKVDDGR